MLPPVQRTTMRALQSAVQHAGPELQQVVKWGNLVFTSRGTHAFALVPHKAQAHLQVFRGAPLTVHFPMLEGNGKGLRHLRFRYGQPIDEELVHEIVRAGLELMHLPNEV